MRCGWRAVDGSWTGTAAANTTVGFPTIPQITPATANIRVVTLDGTPWFVAADVCRALRLESNRGYFGHHTERLGAEEKRITPRSSIGVSGRGGPLGLVSESGLYKLVLRSDKPQARPFQDWVTRDVLPAIRKDGGARTRGGGSVPDSQPMPGPVPWHRPPPGGPGQPLRPLGANLWGH